MRGMAKVGIGALTALVGLAGAIVPASSASAESCPVTSPWGHHGYYMCSTELDAGKADWNGDGRIDEMFVIAPDRTIWHDWAASGGWQPMPGNGRADEMVGTNHDGFQRCVIVKVDSGPSYWQNCFRHGRWHGWEVAGGS